MPAIAEWAVATANWISPETAAEARAERVDIDAGHAVDRLERLEHQREMCRLADRARVDLTTCGAS